jgi:hypothetical protein
MNIKHSYHKSTGHVVADINGKRMLVDTSMPKTFYDEHLGIRVSDLSRILGLPLDGVLGMDSLSGKVLALGKEMIDISGTSPDQAGASLSYVAGIPCVDIKVNEVPCRAAIKTSATTTYISAELLSRDKHSSCSDDFHPVYGKFRVNKFVNYFTIASKSFFADAAELPCEFISFTAGGIDAVLGADLLKRFDLIMDFSANRLHLVSN